jgi:hypothetical protein
MIDTASDRVEEQIDTTSKQPALIRKHSLKQEIVEPNAW